FARVRRCAAQVTAPPHPARGTPRPEATRWPPPPPPDPLHNPAASEAKPRANMDFAPGSSNPDMAANRPMARCGCCPSAGPALEHGHHVPSLRTDLPTLL